MYKRHVTILVILVLCVALCGCILVWHKSTAKAPANTRKIRIISYADMTEKNQKSLRLFAKIKYGILNPFSDYPAERPVTEEETKETSEETPIEKKNYLIMDAVGNHYSIRNMQDFIDGDGNISSDAIYDYIYHLDELYETYETIRNFTTHDGKVIQVGGSPDIDDTYGFLIDEDATFDSIYEALEEGTTAKVDIEWLIPAVTRDQENGDIGNTYIEISLSEQHLWYYINGELYLDTPVVTGLPTDSRHTSAGLFRIWNKATNVNLVGSLDGESWDSFVYYWMSVTYNEIGIHDAPWRGNDLSSYGGNIYTYNGSHGCINLPYDAEKAIYDTVEMNTPVIIY